MKSIKLGFKKYVKGMFGLLVIKLCIIVVIMVSQSCETEESIPKIHAKDNFISSLRKDITNLKKISATNRDSSSSIINKTTVEEVVTTICIYAPDETSRELPSDDTIQIGDLLGIENVESTLTDSEGNESDHIPYGRLLGCFEIPEEPTEESMQASLIDAKNYLYTKGFDDSDIQYLLEENVDGESVDESNLVPLVMAMVAEEENQGGQVALNFSDLFITSTHASVVQGGDLYDCAMRSLGISALTEAFDKGLKSAAGKKALKKAIVKIARRTLGWVGAAWAAYEFGDCMNWW